jgi:hypothetical protein
VGACGQGELREVRRDDELHGDVHGVLDGVVLHEGDAAQEDPRRPRRHFDGLSKRRDGLVGVWRGWMVVWALGFEGFNLACDARLAPVRA